MLLDKIRALNDKLYQLCGELHENEKTVGNYQDEVLKRIFELYKFDYEIISLGLIEERAQRDELKERKELLTPKAKRIWYMPWRKRYNKAAELMMSEAMLRAKEHFNHRERALRELEELIKKADETPPCEVFDEPPCGEGEPEEPRGQGDETQEQEQKSE